jgi:hypothetical protein
MLQEALIGADVKLNVLAKVQGVARRLRTVRTEALRTHYRIGKVYRRVLADAEEHDTRQLAERIRSGRPDRGNDRQAVLTCRLKRGVPS